MLIVGGHQIQIILTWKKNEKRKTDSDVMSNQYEGNDKR